MIQGGISTGVRFAVISCPVTATPILQKKDTEARRNDVFAQCHEACHWESKGVVPVVTRKGLSFLGKIAMSSESHGLWECLFLLLS